MAFFFDEPSRTFNEYLLVPNLTRRGCTPDAVSLGLESVLILNWEKDSSTFLRLEWQALNGKVIKSPIIDSSYELSAIAAHTWKF